jgi:hypothetical protein
MLFLKEAREALDELEATVCDPEFNELMTADTQFRVDGLTAEAILVRQNHEPYHYFFARHRGGAHPRITD